MRKCQVISCNNMVPNFIIVNGIRKNLQRRKFCLDCSPFQEHNTRNLNSRRKSSYENVKAYRKRCKQKCVDYKGSKCKVCGYKRCNEALTFHHLDPSKKDFTIAKMKAWGFSKVKQELDKCVLLCNRCHTELHQGIISL